jgi:DNA-binding transcriptional LysR family regulator
MVTGSVTAAARQLRVAQPSLSRMLKRIEDLVGFPLFERSKGRLLPTLEARQLFASVQHIQAQIEGLDEVIEQIGKGGTGLFRFGASPSLARQLMAICLARLREAFAEVKLHLDVMPLSDIVDYLALGIGECFFTMTPIVNPVVECVEIGTGRLVCLLPASHPLAKRRSLSGRDLFGEKLIMCEPGSPHGLLARAVFEGLGAEPEASITARFAELAIGLTGAGLGVAIVDEFTALGAASDKVAVRELERSPRFQVYLSRGKDQSVSRLSRAFETIVRGQMTGKGKQARPMP